MLSVSQNKLYISVCAPNNRTTCDQTRAGQQENAIGQSQPRLAVSCSVIHLLRTVLQRVLLVESSMICPEILRPLLLSETGTGLQTNPVSSSTADPSTPMSSLFQTKMKKNIYSPILSRVWTLRTPMYVLSPPYFLPRQPSFCGCAIRGLYYIFADKSHMAGTPLAGGSVCSP